MRTVRGEVPCLKRAFFAAAELVEMPSVGDIGAFVANVATSVMIIFVNKLLMRSYGFNFAVTLSGLHYLAAALLMQVYKMTGLMTAKGVMPWNEILLYTGVSSVSIISLNVSLLLNTVRFPPSRLCDKACGLCSVHALVCIRRLF